jgi:hypothetical protein
VKQDPIQEAPDAHSAHLPPKGRATDLDKVAQDLFHLTRVSDHGAAEGFGELLGVVNGQEEELPVARETPFQDQGMPMGVGS